MAKAGSSQLLAPEEGSCLICSSAATEQFQYVGSAGEAGRSVP